MCKDKKVCRIDDPRIETYEKRTRSGSEQVFYTGSDERDFDRWRAEGGNKKHGVEMHDKPDTIRITPPERHYYAELIEGEWWWVNGCAECNGRPRDWMTHIECEDHDRCAHCGCSREALAEPPWGRKDGWVCKPCAEIEAAAERHKALSKVAEEEYDEWDYHHTDEIICPHCAT
ncbi:MAG: hypothetical protein OQK12_09915, partial [Motiliproteus sp.]|nr:hypothetical protein [Motiliproteus sp.]